MSEEEALALIAEIPGVAERHREGAKSIGGIDLDYRAESIPKLDEMIREGWPDGPPAMLDATVLSFGSYLGETIRRVHGGDWGFSPEHGIHLDVGGLGIKIFPFAKVEKRFVNGEEDSLGYFYSFVASKVEEARNTAAPPDRGQPAISQEMQDLVDVAFAAASEWLKEGKTPLFNMYVKNGKQAISLPSADSGAEGFENVRRWARGHPQISSLLLMGLTDDPKMGKMLAAHCGERGQAAGFVLGLQLKEGEGGVLESVGEVFAYRGVENPLQSKSEEAGNAPAPPSRVKTKPVLLVAVLTTAAVALPLLLLGYWLGYQHRGRARAQAPGVEALPTTGMSREAVLQMLPGKTWYSRWETKDRKRPAEIRVRDDGRIFVGDDTAKEWKLELRWVLNEGSHLFIPIDDYTVHGFFIQSGRQKGLFADKPK